MAAPSQIRTTLQRQRKATNQSNVKSKRECDASGEKGFIQQPGRPMQTRAFALLGSRTCCRVQSRARCHRCHRHGARQLVSSFHTGGPLETRGVRSKDTLAAAKSDELFQINFIVACVQKFRHTLSQLAHTTARTSTFCNVLYWLNDLPSASTKAMISSSSAELTSFISPSSSSPTLNSARSITPSWFVSIASKISRMFAFPDSTARIILSASFFVIAPARKALRNSS